MSAIPTGPGNPPAQAATPQEIGPVPETFFSVVIRRARYVVAIAACAFLFQSLGWALIAPAQIPGMPAASFLLGPSTAGLLAALCILVLLLVSIALSMAIVHPDAPHTGLYCACLGLAALSIRGGSIRLVVAQAQAGRLWGLEPAPALGLALPTQQAAFFTRLIAEAALWIVILFLADAFCLTLFRRIFKNVRWLIHSGSSAETPAALLQHSPNSPVVDLALEGTPMGATPNGGDANNPGKEALTQIGSGALMVAIGLVVTFGSFAMAQHGGLFGGFYLCTWGLIAAGVAQIMKGLGTALGDRFDPKLGAVLTTTLFGASLLMVLLKSELLGQVLFACFVSFFIAAFVANQVFPRAATWAIWVAVPITAIIGYAIARNQPVPFPGHLSFPLARALPMDYIAAGVPGAVLGYYTSLRWQIHQIVHEQ